MQRLLRIKKLLLLTMVLILFCQIAGCNYDGNDKETPGPVKRYQNPVIMSNSPDPSIIRHEGVYYLYITDYLKTIKKSVNLVDWEDTNVRVFDIRPDWGTVTDEKIANVWAPDIVKIGNKFILYYALSIWGDPNPGIGVASAPHPLGPWTDHGKLFNSQEIGVNNSIDPSVFVGHDGKVYMIWGSFRGIYGIELESDGLSLKGGLEHASQNKVLIAGNDTSLPWNARTYEAPYVIYKNEYYYLFLSSGLTLEGINSNYNVKVARSRNPLGPYYDNEHRDMLAPDRGKQVIQGGGMLFATGHNCVAVDDAGQYWLVYHLLMNNNGKVASQRYLGIDKLLWDNGWPYVQSLMPSRRAEVPVINQKINNS